MKEHQFRFIRIAAVLSCAAVLGGLELTRRWLQEKTVAHEHQIAHLLGRRKPLLTSKTMDGDSQIVISAPRELSQNDKMIIAEMASWLRKVAMLKGELQKEPDKGIPELALLREIDWLTEVQSRDMNSEKHRERALESLRSLAKIRFGAAGIKPALQQYLKDKAGKMPDSTLELMPYIADNDYFSAGQVTIEMLNRYAPQRIRQGNSESTFMAILEVDIRNSGDQSIYFTDKGFGITPPGKR